MDSSLPFLYNIGTYQSSITSYLSLKYHFIKCYFKLHSLYLGSPQKKQQLLTSLGIVYNGSLVEL
jgi:hypothetical protein